MSRRPDERRARQPDRTATGRRPDGPSGGTGPHRCGRARGPHGGQVRGAVRSGRRGLTITFFPHSVHSGAPTGCLGAAALDYGMRLPVSVGVRRVGQRHKRMRCAWSAIESPYRCRVSVSTPRPCRTPIPPSEDRRPDARRTASRPLSQLRLPQLRIAPVAGRRTPGREPWERNRQHVRCPGHRAGGTAPMRCRPRSPLTATGRATTPRPTTSGSPTLRPTAAKPTAPKPSTPKPTVPKPTAPKPRAPKPTVPKPRAQRPMVPIPDPRAAAAPHRAAPEGGLTGPAGDPAWGDFHAGSAGPERWTADTVSPDERWNP